MIWSALLLVFAAQLWWASFGLANSRKWDFGTFAVILIPNGALVHDERHCFARCAE